MQSLKNRALLFFSILSLRSDSARIIGAESIIAIHDRFFVMDYRNYTRGPKIDIYIYYCVQAPMIGRKILYLFFPNHRNWATMDWAEFRNCGCFSHHFSPPRPYHCEASTNRALEKPVMTSNLLRCHRLALVPVCSFRRRHALFIYVCRAVKKTWGVGTGPHDCFF